MRLAAEFIMLILIIFLVGFFMWKFALSKIPAIRMALKLSKIEEIDTLSEHASNVDIAKTKQRKSFLNDFEKENL
jgi:hypothetical protein